MRIGIAAAIACSCGGRPPPTPTPTIPDRTACPANAAELVAGTYAAQEPGDVRIAACVWGSFAGPGWMIVHAVGDKGGIAFVDGAGQLVASGHRGAHDVVDARRVDVDGDGTDELLVKHRWESSQGPGAGVALLILHVERESVVQIGWVPLAFADAGGRCRGDVTFDRGAIVVVGSPEGPSNPGGESCPAPGTHVFHVRGDELVED